MDSGDKGCNKALAVAHKYALFQTFLIPTEDAVDPDFTTYDTVQPGTPPVTSPWPGAIGGPLEGVTPVAPPPPHGGFREPAPAPVNQLQINTPDGAHQHTDMLINLAQASHSDSFDNLKKFWLENKQIIDFLDTHHPTEYARLKDYFTVLHSNLTEEQNNA
jgi:hypothetical protein